jgi:GDP/UDP-N,N'-diacetylbacillosamine 2-epimerase (hydrolysing)
MKIAVVTGSRAEYGLLKNLMHAIKDDCELELQVIVTGMHLSYEFGFTVNEIIGDNFEIDAKVEMLLSSDTPSAIVKSMGIAHISFADVYEGLSPDALLVLGDRFEILAAVSASLPFVIPIIHLHGGELTLGAFDDSIRHAITKMSHLHFTSTDSYRDRVIQMGENPISVFNVGAIGCENIRKMKLLSKKELENKIDFLFPSSCLMVTYHPVTLDADKAEDQIKNLLDALEKLGKIGIIFTKANADTSGRIINQLIDQFVIKDLDNRKAYFSMGQLNYFSSLQYVDAVVGNSSSGILEVPSFNIPTINIGDRQKGRIQATSVINCKPSKNEIYHSIKNTLNRDKEIVKNPYSKPYTIKTIIEEIKKFEFLKIKTFFTIGDS